MTTCARNRQYQIVGTAEASGAPLFAELAENVAEAPPLRPKPLDQDGLLACSTAIRRPAQRRGWSRPPTRHARQERAPKESLEVSTTTPDPPPKPDRRRTKLRRCDAQAPRPPLSIRAVKPWSRPPIRSMSTRVQ
jgi:hypothetical protein